MKNSLSALLLWVLLLGACSTVPLTEISVPSTTTGVPPATTSASQPSVTPTERSATETQPPGSRQAVLTEMENTVSARLTAISDLLPAAKGMTISSGGATVTGNDGRARLDLLPDGTIVRVGPNSSFTVSEITETDGAPKTTLELLFGKVYILLNGGSLNVKTPTGIASVQGSVMSVEYDPGTKRMQTVCLEGHCSLADGGGNKVSLTQDQMSYMDYGMLPAPPGKINSAEIQDWLKQVPEIQKFFEKLPNPRDYPPPDNPLLPGNGGGLPPPPDGGILPPPDGIGGPGGSGLGGGKLRP